MLTTLHPFLSVFEKHGADVDRITRRKSLLELKTAIAAGALFERSCRSTRGTRGFLTFGNLFRNLKLNHVAAGLLGELKPLRAKKLLDARDVFFTNQQLNLSAAPAPTLRAASLWRGTG